MGDPCSRVFTEPHILPSSRPSRPAKFSVRRKRKSRLQLGLPNRAATSGCGHVCTARRKAGLAHLTARLPLESESSPLYGSCAADFNIRKPPDKAGSTARLWFTAGRCPLHTGSQDPIDIRKPDLHANLVANSCLLLPPSLPGTCFGEEPRPLPPLVPP